MRSTALVGASLIVASAVWLGAQKQPLHAPDGGTREMITSVVIPPTANAPFSATVNTEWTRYLEDGATRLWQNHRAVARDRTGRVFQERRNFATGGLRADTRLTRTEIADPRAHTLTYCYPDRNVCEVRFFAGDTLTPTAAAPQTEQERLGTQVINGLELIGTRETTRLPAPVVGTDRPLTITKEFWYSARLGVNVSTKRVDPRSGVEMFSIVDIVEADPDPAWFSLPANAHVIDYRTAVAR